MSKSKISKEELENIQSQVNKMNEIQFKIGEFEVAKSRQMAEYAKEQEALAVIQKELSEKYGSINIDLATGEYTEQEIEDAQEDLEE